MVQVPCPCGSEMSPPALTHPSPSAFVDPLIFCISTHGKCSWFVFLVFFFPFLKIILQRVLLPKPSHLQTWMQSCHIQARLSMSLPGLADTQEPGLGCPGDLGELYKHMLLIWGALVLISQAFQTTNEHRNH